MPEINSFNRCLKAKLSRIFASETRSSLPCRKITLKLWNDLFSVFCKRMGRIHGWMFSTKENRTAKKNGSTEGCLGCILFKRGVFLLRSQWMSFLLCTALLCRPPASVEWRRRKSVLGTSVPEHELCTSRKKMPGRHSFLPHPNEPHVRNHSWVMNQRMDLTGSATWPCHTF